MFNEQEILLKCMFLFDMYRERPEILRFYQPSSGCKYHWSVNHTLSSKYLRHNQESSPLDMFPKTASFLS